MKPVLSVRLIDQDTGYEIEKLTRVIPPVKEDYKVIDNMLMRVYRWNFVYSIADEMALRMEEEIWRKENETETNRC